MGIVKDDRQRLRILDSLCQYYWQDVKTIEDCPHIEVTPENQIIRWYKGKNGSWYEHDITDDGMLYELMVLTTMGWIQKFNSKRKCHNAVEVRKASYCVTELGVYNREELRKTIATERDDEYLASCNTRYLLMLLHRARYGGTDYSVEKIKAVLATREHVERPAQRRQRLYKKEKGDSRRVRQERRKDTRVTPSKRRGRGR